MKEATTSSRLDELREQGLYYQMEAGTRVGLSAKTEAVEEVET